MLAKIKLSPLKKLRSIFFLSESLLDRFIAPETCMLNFMKVIRAVSEIQIIHTYIYKRLASLKGAQVTAQ